MGDQENETEEDFRNCWCQDFHFPEEPAGSQETEQKLEYVSSVLRDGWGWKAAEVLVTSPQAGRLEGVCVCACVCAHVCVHAHCVSMS